MPAKDKKRIKPVIEEVVEESPVVESFVEEPKEEIVESVPAVTEEVLEAPVDDIPSPSPEVKHHKENKMNLKLIIVITVVSALVAAFVSGGVYVYLSGLDAVDEPENEVVLEPASTSTPAPSPSATPEAEIELSEYSVQVLNGSGAIGAASGGEDVLTEAGFNVENTGNASRYNYEKTTIQVKGSVPAAVVSELKEALENGDYEVEMGSALPDSSQYDIVVIVGRN